jgi:hypothetical protein
LKNASVAVSVENGLLVHTPLPNLKSTAEWDGGSSCGQAPACGLGVRHLFGVMTASR